MVKVLKGFIVDRDKTTLSKYSVVFTKGQLIDLSSNIVYMRRSFQIPREDGEFHIYYDYMREKPLIKYFIDDYNPCLVFLGTLTVTDSDITMQYADYVEMPDDSLVNEVTGITHSETIDIINGNITLNHMPNIIVEIYVDGFGFIDISDNINVEGNVVSFGTNDLDGYSVRIVYES